MVDRMSPIIVVGTHLDKLKSEEGRKGKKGGVVSDCCRELEAQLQAVPGFQRIKQFFFISNKVSRPFVLLI